MSTRSPQTRLQKRLVSSRHFLLSGLEDREKKELAEKIAGLGGVNLVSETFKPACTHLVCGRLSRSEKFLCACAMGRWILHPQYVTDSSERGEWLQEEEYEWVNYPQNGLSEFMNAGRRCRFNVEAFKSLPFSGWRVAVVVRGSRKSSIYSRLLSCGGAEIYKLSLPVGNRSRVADVLTYVFVGERNIPDVLHLIEYGIMCLRPEFIGDYILQDPPPDPVDYLVKLEASKLSIELGTVDINNSTADILFSQSGSSQSTPSSKSLTGSHGNTPWRSSHSTPQGTPLKNVQNKSTKPVAVSPLVLIDLSQTPDSPSSLEPAQIILNDSSRKRKMGDNLDKAVRQLKRCKMTHRGDLWHPSVFTGLSAEEDKEPVEIVLPFPASLEGMILACFEEDSSNPNFFLAGLDMVVSSISNRQSPTASIIKVILHGMLEVPGTNSFQTDLIQYRCYDVLMKILNLHPPTTPRAINLYQAVLNNTDDVTCDQRNIIRSFLQARSDKDGPLFPKGRILLLQFIVAALEVNLQHYLDRVDKGEIGTRKLRGCMFAQTLWPGSTLMSFNSTCKELVLLFGLCITEDMDSLFKRDLVKLTTSLICMAVLLVQYVETGQRVALYEPIVPSPTAASLLHEATRQVPSTLSNELLRTILRNLTPSWITVHFCYLLLRNLDDYLLLQELPTDDVDLREIVTKFFFLLPKINSRQSNILQRPHQKKVDHRLPEEPRPRTRKTLRTACGKENESMAGLSGVRNVNKKNVKGETPLQVACIKNNLKKVRELLRLADVDVNTCDYAGWTPLHEACNHGHLEIVKELLNFVPAKTVDHFFSPGSRKRKKVNLLAVTTELITPLHDAVMNNRLDVCKLLLQHGGPVLLERKTALNQTPLDLAPTSQMRELLLLFTENRSLRSFSQGSFSSDCPADSPPSEYLYEQVLGEEDRGFADREECAKYIGVISTLVHAYLQVIDYNQIQAIMEGKTTLSMKGVKMKQSAGQDIIHNGTETSSPQCQVYSNNSNQLTPQKSRSCSDMLLIQRDFKTACKLSMHVERFTDHLQRITREEDFASLQFDLCMLTQTAASCQMSVK